VLHAEDNILLTSSACTWAGCAVALATRRWLVIAETRMQPQLNSEVRNGRSDIGTVFPSSSSLFGS
jgi:hypothetical protein